MHTSVRLSEFVIVIASSLFLMLAGANFAAAESSERAEPDSITFGLLGPVGLVAITLGILGMAAGVARQRRRAKASLAESALSVPYCSSFDEDNRVDQVANR